VLQWKTYTRLSGTSSGRYKGGNVKRIKKCVTKFIQYPIAFVTNVGSILWPKAPDRVLVTIKERRKDKLHHLLYDADKVPCDMCILKVISDAYNIPVHGLSVVEKKPTKREVGQCTKPGKRGTWSLRKLDKVHKV
jgi:hypothetical protein